MPHGYRAAVHVHLLVVQAELADDGEALGRERFVQLHEVEVADGHARALQELPDGWHRAYSHHARIDARNRAADEAAERFDAQRRGALFTPDHECGRSVVDAARVAGRDGAALAKPRFEGGEPFRTRIGTWMLIPRQPIDRDEFFVEAARLRGRRPALL